MKYKKIVQLLCLLFTLESCHMYAPPKKSPKGKSAKDVAKTSAKVKTKQASDDELLDAILSNSEHQIAIAVAKSSGVNNANAHVVMTKSYEQELADKFKRLTTFQQDTLLRLIFMISNNQIDEARALINELKDLTIFNSQDVVGLTILMCACLQGSQDLVGILLDKGANPNLYTKDGDTVLMFAAQYNRIEIVRLLLNKGADINQKNFLSGATALMIALSKGHIDIARLLINSRGLVVDMQNDTGWTALIIAAYNGYIDIVRLLINKGAGLNKQIFLEGATALMVAVQKGHIQIVKMLLDNGALVNLKNSYGLTALMIAENKGHTEIARMIQGFLEQQLGKEEEDSRVQILHEEQKALQDLLEQEEEGFANLDPLFRLRRELPKVTNWADEWTEK